MLHKCQRILGSRLPHDETLGVTNHHESGAEVVEDRAAPGRNRETSAVCPCGAMPFIATSCTRLWAVM